MDTNGEHNENPTGEKETIYIFTVHGFAPELMRGMAFRIEKHFKTKGKKILKCPYCGSVFEIIDMAVKVELRCFSRKSIPPGHPAIPCRTCHKKVGIIYASA
jgi:ribosomal protein L34E